MKSEVTVESLALYINRGITPKYTEVIDDSIIVLNQKCIRDFKVSLEPSRRNDLSKRKITEGKMLKKHDVLINSTGVGTLGRVAQYFGADDDATVDSHVTIVRPNPELVDPIYFGYLMKSKQSLIESFAEGTTGQTELNRNSVKELLLEIVNDIPTQKIIGGILFEIDQKLELNTQTNQTIEQIAQALFNSWFVDFDPVKAKMEILATGGSNEDAELAAMSVISAKTIDELHSMKASNPEAFASLAETAALFPEAMQDSELGEIPEGWSVEQLGNHLDVLQTGSRPKGGVGGITEGVPSVGAENILGVGKYTYGKEKFVSREFFDKLNRGVVEDFDFLLYKDGGKPGEFKPRVSMFGCGFPYSEFAINEHVFRMRSESLGQAFLYFQIGHKRVLDILANRGGKAAIPGINQTDVKTIPILIPSAADLLTEFNNFATKAIESILKKSNENNLLVSVRDTLLPKLLLGEIDLSNETVA